MFLLNQCLMYVLCVGSFCEMMYLTVILFSYKLTFYSSLSPRGCTAQVTRKQENVLTVILRFLHQMYDLPLVSRIFDQNDLLPLAPKTFEL